MGKMTSGRVADAFCTSIEPRTTDNLALFAMKLGDVATEGIVQVEALPLTR